ncbi:ROK family transcriptional regulator [Actinoplanes couchii]|uniref:Transcriptional regulator n=1 Tax=Actinoplanes couchii TaxID=403638 RepID=A0ABQ3X1Q2_9ACTN|nr:ROK family transcriptional regulator [Actinoplanes couchii]MDR6316839.1 putative NBD/HSP70 family sugar kinase [Actinoplanes couchii]GID52446.1 transcriptional regulator [Actinoplanes couchii]
MRAPHADLTSAGGIFSLVRDGRAASRAELSRLTGLAPSTVALRIDELIRHGYLTESGQGPSQGGRRPRRLGLAYDNRLIAGVDLGARHATLRVYDLAGTRVSGRDIVVDIGISPESVLRTVFQQLSAMNPGRELAGIGLAVPGPVRTVDRRVVSPSRMPGWNGVDPAAILAGISGVPVRTENDANAMAVGEFVATGRTAAHLILVKVGASIGTGIIASGTLHRGSRGIAGDVSHTRVTDDGGLCSCGRTGCLDTVAGGRSMVLALQAAGEAVSDVADVVRLARDAHPLASRLLREAGQRTGVVLATLVGFFNPERLVLAGSLSSSDVFVAAVRSAVYDQCLPVSTEGLEIGASSAGPDIGARGVAALVIDELLDPQQIDEKVRLLR